MQGADGRTTELFISSPTAANLPTAAVQLAFVRDGRPAWNSVGIEAADGLHAPDGKVYTDPYEEKELKFAGFKWLIFHVKPARSWSRMVEHALQPLRDAGYNAVNHRFEKTDSGSMMDVTVFWTLDGRKLIEEKVLKRHNWKARAGETKGNKGVYDYEEVKYRGTAKATMKLPISGALVWEITAEVTFTKDESLTTEEHIVLTTSEGSLTKTQYTFPGAPPNCYGDPPFFTDTYPIFSGDGHLFLKGGSDPLEYRGNASISANTPVQSHAYDQCCSVLEPPCERKTMDRDEQEHEWWSTGASFMTAEADGTLRGSYSHPYGASYEWTFTRVEEGE